MKYYMSEGEAMYMDKNFGLFSKKLAEWAINNMETLDSSSKTMKKISARSLDDVAEVLKQHKIELPNEFMYTAWYLFNMAIADYPKTCKTDEQRAMFVEETICDPDGHPENVLACFVAKMCENETPIQWERYL